MPWSDLSPNNVLVFRSTFLFSRSRGRHRFGKHAPSFIPKHDDILSCTPRCILSMLGDYRQRSRQKPTTTDETVGDKPRPSLIPKLFTLGEPLRTPLPSFLSYTILINFASFLYGLDIIGCTHKPLLWNTVIAWINLFIKEVTSWWWNPRKDTNKKIFHKNRINVTCKWLFSSQLYLPRVCCFHVLSVITRAPSKKLREPLLENEMQLDVPHSKKGNFVKFWDIACVSTWNGDVLF